MAYERRVSWLFEAAGEAWEVTDFSDTVIEFEETEKNVKRLDKLKSGILHQWVPVFLPYYAVAEAILAGKKTVGTFASLAGPLRALF